MNVDLFCGAGGASLAMHRVGLDPVGFDHDRDACATHAAAGFRTVRCDLSTFPWEPFAGRVDVMHGSPPCQPFSASGKGHGELDDRDGMPWMVRAVEAVRPRVVTVENVKGLTFKKHLPYLHWFLIALEQQGYDVAWAVLNAADYGIPQTRERLIVVARRDRQPISWPAPTHTEQAGLFTDGWVSMAEALGWNETVTVAQQRGAGMVERHGARAPRPATRPAPTVTGGRHGDASRRWVVDVGQDSHLPDGTTERYTRTVDLPSPTVDRAAGTRWKLRSSQTTGGTGERFRRSTDRPAIAVGTNAGGRWVWERPATAVQGDQRLFQPCHHGLHGTGTGRSENAVRVELHELATLQGFPDGYPWQGTRTSIARQIGNACPAALLAAVLEANLRRGEVAA